MTCRCATSAEHSARAQQQNTYSELAEKESSKKKISSLEQQLLSMTPDPTHYEIVKVLEIRPYLVLKVQFPNCAKCAFEGNKVLVYCATPLEAMMWKHLDPHFRLEKATSAKDAPSPIARFPASEEGWKDAVFYATHRKS